MYSYILVVPAKKDDAVIIGQDIDDVIPELTYCALQEKLFKAVGENTFMLLPVADFSKYSKQLLPKLKKYIKMYKKQADARKRRCFFIINLITFSNLQNKNRISAAFVFFIFKSNYFAFFGFFFSFLCVSPFAIKLYLNLMIIVHRT